jgi:hypothetical protein
MRLMNRSLFAFESAKSLDSWVAVRRAASSGWPENVRLVYFRRRAESLKKNGLIIFVKENPKFKLTVISKDGHLAPSFAQGLPSQKSTGSSDSKAESFRVHSSEQSAYNISIPNQSFSTTISTSSPLFSGDPSFWPTDPSSFNANL